MTIRKTLFVLFALPFFASADYAVKPFMLPSGIIYWAVQQVVGTITVHAEEITLKDQVKSYIRTMSDFVGIDGEFMVKIGSCESWDYKEDVINNIQLGDNNKSMGVFQWQTHSWAYYNKVFGLDLDRTKWSDQVRLTTLVAERFGTKKDWVNCTLFAKTGIYPK